MGKIFTNILALIDLPDDPELCFRSAIDTANRLESNLHVLYRSRMEDNEMQEGKGDYPNIINLALLNIYRPMLDKHRSLHIHIVDEPTGKSAFLYARKNKIDLTLIWKTDGSFLSAPIAMARCCRLSHKLSCPVLYLPGQVSIRNIKNVILPVKQALPAGKLVLAVQLAKLCKAKIHLVGVANYAKTAKKDQYLFKTCQLLRNNTNLEVDCKMVKGVGLARATAKYVITVDAGLILVCTGKKLLLLSVACSLLTRPTSGLAKIPIMTVPPEQLYVL